jgi:hypothetical protein
MAAPGPEPSEPTSESVPTVAPEPAPEPPPHYPFHDPLPGRVLAKTSSAMKNANLAPWQCRKELRRRKLPFRRDRRPAKGVAEAYRVDGPLHGVKFVTPRSPSPYGILDCRLALTLDDFAAVLAEQGVVQVRIDNFYRPGARLPGSRKMSQHGYGLAIDLVSFALGDGTVLNVEQDWGSGIGVAPCGPDAQLVTPTEHSVALRNLACVIARSGLFHHLLTPGHDAPHRNHLHLDIKRGEKTWFLE